MIYDIKNINVDEYKQFINENGVLFQRIEWIKSNGVGKYFPIIVRSNKDICIAGTYIFIKYKNEKCMYFPRGPIFSNSCTLTSIKEFIEYIKEEAISNNCKEILLDCKYALLKDDNGYEIENNLLESGFNKSSFSRFWHYNWSINIDEININEYLVNLKQKTRYNINYAKKRGLKISIDNSEDSIKKFYKLLQITAKRDGFKVKEYDSYLDLFKYFKDDIKLFWIYKDKTLLSAAIYIIIGNQAYYVYGASSNIYREDKPTYLMQYKMIDYSIQNNCKIYNMGGIGILNSNGSIKMNKGLYEFKKKFGGFIQDSSYTYIMDI